MISKSKVFVGVFAFFFSINAKLAQNKHEPPPFPPLLKSITILYITTEKSPEFRKSILRGIARHNSSKEQTLPASLQLGCYHKTKYILYYFRGRFHETLRKCVSPLAQRLWYKLRHKRWASGLTQLRKVS